MFGRKGPVNPKIARAVGQQVYAPNFIEALEDRRLLSASVAHHVHHASVHHTKAAHASLKHSTATASTTSSTAGSNNTSNSNSSDGDSGGGVDTITFSQAPSVVQTGLTTLASKDGLAAPTSTQTVHLSNSNGVESYTLDFTSTGTTTKITVDQNGNAVTAPTQSTTTWATLSGTGAGSNAKASAEISAIVTALGLTAPTSTTTVNVSTASDGTVTYSANLAGSSATGEHDATQVSVDSNGNPVGRQTLPFSVIPTAIQNGFNNNLPTGATALAATSTQNVDVQTVNGLTFYSTTFIASGTTTTVTVNSAGALTSLPSTTDTTFSTLPAAAQTELQTLANADGFSGTIGSGQAVTAYNEGNGTTVYSVTLSATNSSSQTVTITVSADQAGNPTVPPREGHGHGCGGEGSGGFAGGGDFGAVDFGLASFGGGRFG
ncbi:MAG: hypothetical protein JWN24_4901 [Phycisphaerales bacterium]|nr:hypothetical protein [Phycisphaerales bacterium]